MSESAHLRVIIVDDEEPARMAVRHDLEALGGVTIVAECANGFEAVRAVNEQPGEQPVDLLLLDVQMPKLDGFDVLELIGRDVPVIFITAYDEFALRAFDVHAVDYLLKPFARERLQAALERARARRQAGERVAAGRVRAAGGGGAVVGVGAGELPPGLARDEALRREFEEALRESPARAAAWLATMPVPDRRQEMADELARRLQANPRTQRVGVLNHGIGGNRLLRDGLGPNALARFDRDVICQTGVRWLVILEGINDLGTRNEARAKGERFATAADVIAAYSQMIERAHTHGIRVIGATLLPFEGSKNYWTADGDEDRRTINTWIRTSGRFDAVIDFEAALRDRENPNRLAAVWDNDHLHPSLAGYVAMAHAVDLALFHRSFEAGKAAER